MPTTPTTPGVYVTEGTAPPSIAAAPTATVFLGWTPNGTLDAPIEVRSFVDFTNQCGGLSSACPFGHSIAHFFANGGRVAQIVRVAHAGAPDTPVLAGTETFASLLPTALARLAATAFDVLCVPGETRPDVLATVQSYCVERRAFLIADAPAGATLASLAGGAPAALTGAGGANTAWYWPWVRAPDPLAAGVPTAYPPSGFVAGIYARTDTNRGVWKAPAGLETTLTGALGLTQTITDAEQAPLNANAVNVLREFPSGRVVWGARTLAGQDVNASEWKYVPVRRLLLYVERSLDHGLDWAVFEPNAEPLWARVRLTVGAFLQSLFRSGAFQGTSPRDAYFVHCDATTMTQDDLEQGRLICQIGIAPLRPAEFVTFRIETRTGPGGAAVAATAAPPVGQRIVPTARWDDLVAAPPTLAALHAVSGALGARERPAAAIVLSGDAGTGKTLAAQVLAAEHRLQLYRVDLGAVLSKYVGETEKNLDRAFDEAARLGAVLLFDEADALFAKRTEIQDAHDRYANAAVTWLSTPRWPPVFLETRAPPPAPARGAWTVVEFRPPDRDQRRELWRRHWPEWAGADAATRERLEQVAVTGGTIAGAARADVVAEGRPIEAAALLRRLRGHRP